jgi:serine/threonine protein kinase
MCRITSRLAAPERFIRKTRLAARLDHPHILPVYDSGETNRGSVRSEAGFLR